MTERMTTERLAEIRARCAALPVTRLIAGAYDEGVTVYTVEPLLEDMVQIGREVAFCEGRDENECAAYADLFAHAPLDLLDLMVYAERLKAERRDWCIPLMAQQQGRIEELRGEIEVLENEREGWCKCATRLLETCMAQQRGDAEAILNMLRGLPLLTNDYSHTAALIYHNQGWEVVTLSTPYWAGPCGRGDTPEAALYDALDEMMEVCDGNDKR